MRLKIIDLKKNCKDRLEEQASAITNARPNKGERDERSEPKKKIHLDAASSTLGTKAEMTRHRLLLLASISRNRKTGP